MDKWLLVLSQLLPGSYQGKTVFQEQLQTLAKQKQQQKTEKNYMKHHQV